MYGKHFESMYEGSMVGSGAVVFAVMGYIIAKQQPDRTVGSQVRLNPTLLSAILGEDEKDIEKAIAKLCAPDSRTSTKTKEGRRLIKLGEFDYQVVNGAKYQSIRNAEDRREQNRVAQRTFRARKYLGPSAEDRQEVVRVESENEGIRQDPTYHPEGPFNGKSAWEEEP